jgi:hypothetical protein
MVSISVGTYLAKNQDKLQVLPWDSGEPWMYRDIEDLDLSTLRDLRSREIIKKADEQYNRNIRTWVIDDSVRQYYLDRYVSV